MAASVMVMEKERVTHYATPLNKVIILGAGISGMLAAKACEERDHSFTIIDRGPPEALPRIVKGCVYLHQPCGLERYIRRQVLMTSVLLVPGIRPTDLARLYHRKIWGEWPDAENSLDKYVGQQDIWSMNEALDYLHRRYLPYMAYQDVDWPEVKEWLDEGHKVISTLPIYALFPAKPRISKPLWTWQVEGVLDPNAHNAYTVYNVDPAIAWYRASSMFGNLSMEFNQEPAGLSTMRFQKIVSADMTKLDRLHPRLMFVGRWARWQRGYLSHMAYREVCEKWDTGEWR